MSYTKNTWANGDVITATKLNHMEDGIEGAGSGGGGFDATLVISVEDETPVVTVASGTFADFSSKFSNGEHPTAQVFADSDEGYNLCFVSNVLDGGDDNILIIAFTMTGVVGEFFGDTLACFGFTISWDANGAEIQ